MVGSSWNFLWYVLTSAVNMAMLLLPTCQCCLFHWPFLFPMSSCLPSVLWHCWLGGRKGIRPVKTEWWGAGVVVCLEQGAGLHMAQLMPLPLTVSCFSKIQIGFTFLVLAHLGSPGQRAVKRVCVCMCVCVQLYTRSQSAIVFPNFV